MQRSTEYLNTKIWKTRLKIALDFFKKTRFEVNTIKQLFLLLVIIFYESFFFTFFLPQQQNIMSLFKSKTSLNTFVKKEEEERIECRKKSKTKREKPNIKMRREKNGS